MELGRPPHQASTQLFHFQLSSSSVAASVEVPKLCFTQYLYGCALSLKKISVQAREGPSEASEIKPMSNRAEAAHMQKQTQDQHLMSIPSSSLVKPTNQRTCSLPKSYLVILPRSSYP